MQTQEENLPQKETQVCEKEAQMPQEEKTKVSEEAALFQPVVRGRGGQDTSDTLHAKRRNVIRSQ